MENSLVKSGGSEKSKKSESFDVQRVIKNGGSENGKRKVSLDGDSELVNTYKKKKSKKEALRNLEVVGKQSRSGFNKDRGNLSGSNKSSHLEGKLEILLSLDSEGNGIKIPKKPRGFVGHRKSEGNIVSNLPLVDKVDEVAREQVPSNGKASSAEKIAKSHGGVKEKIVSLKGKGNIGIDGNKKRSCSSSGKSSARVSEKEGVYLGVKSYGGVKEKNVILKDKGNIGINGNKKRNSSSSSSKISARVSKEEEMHLGVHNNRDASSSRKRSSKNKKRKGTEFLLPKVEPVDDISLNMLVNSHDEDEENLEQNAARMLSSRFDPRCTQSDEDFVLRQRNISADLELVSGDLDNRVLRPRKKHKGDDSMKKRRKFYEILVPDLDAYSLVNKRIKVFWPLDESWYYGLVSGYSPVTKLHHIKYDDQDEEWIDLQNERFKLLLLPNEVPHMPELKGDDLGNKNDEKDMSSEDTLEISYMDSEPIISWLPVKTSRLGSSKKHKTSHLSSKLSQKLSKKDVNTKEGLDKSDYSKRDVKKLNPKLAQSVKTSDSSRVENSQLEVSSFSRDENISVVYVRRRFRKKDNELIDTDSKACGNTPLPTTVSVPNVLDPSRENDMYSGLTESERLLWSVDNVGLLKLTVPFLECEKLRLELGFPFSVMKTFGAEDSWLFQALLMLKFGVVMNKWPKVNLEILFVDNIVGLRFLLFEGSLNQAVQFVLLVMAVFQRADQNVMPVDMLMPVTSIRFKLSCSENSKKQHIFAVYSFSEVKCSEWLYLNSKLQQHCLLAKQLPLSECTYDNIKALESGNNQLPLISRSRTSSANEGLWKKSLHGIVPKGNLIGPLFGAMHRSPSKYHLKRGSLPFALSFSAAPSFFLSLHMKLLMENNIASFNLYEDQSRYSLEHSENSCHPIKANSIHVPETSPAASPVILSMEVESLKCTSSKPIVGLEIELKCSVNGQLLNNHHNGKFDVAFTSSSTEGSDENAGDAIVRSLETENGDPNLKQFVTSTSFSVSIDKDHGLSVELPVPQSDERPFLGTTPTSTPFSDNGSRLTWHSGSNDLNTSHVRAGINPDFILNGFSSGPRKPRTQVKYVLPSGGIDSILKHNVHNYRGLPFHRIRKANDNRALEVSKNLQRSKGFLACDANVLITYGEKGWRESGARVELESAEHNEWKLAVKFSGATKFSYKAYHFFQPGSTNRYTHAMMWRGGKDWVLEFPDRNQWMVFKEMYEECFNRNLRAASVKNIPIPGVRVIEECDATGTELPFFRSSDYFRQVETDAEMAMDPSHILYDMDSEDEVWISEYQKLSSVTGRECEEVTEELFERTMDMLEKVAFAQQRDDFSFDEIEEFMVDIGPMESIRTIHKYWQRKRVRKGMPLVRHLQPPLWECYQQQLKDWEQAVARANKSKCNGRNSLLEKPAMFAFCLKPRGLEMPNKGSKQRAHRRLPVSGSSFSLLGDHDGLYASGRRLNGAHHGDGKVMYLGNTHEYSDTSPTFKSSTTFSPRDAGGFGQSPFTNDMSEWNQHRKFNRNKSKNAGFFPSPNNAKVLGSYNQKTLGKRNGVNRLNTSLPQWPNQRQHHSDVPLRYRYGLDQLDGSDFDEFRLRDASGAAQHAHNMARLKREKAQRLLYRADLATHKAIVSLMTAEAIKASFEDVSDDDDEDSDNDDDELTEDDYSTDDDTNDYSSDSDRTR